jgi:DNA-binding MarR family transcriptional regulator
MMRRQRKRIVQLPESMLEEHSRLFPETFERNSTLALFAIRALGQRLNDYANEWLSPFGLNAAKYNYLVVLTLSKDRQLTLNELSSLIHTSNATVGSMVDALERDGLVERVANPQDRRSTVARVTRKGLATLRRALPVHHRNIETGMRALSISEREILVKLLHKLASGFEESFGEDRDPAGEETSQPA